ncbi:hypothetical protein P4V86_03695 [Brevibacillus laterosporus]|uniref:hypothetical protein n=1 Tax=Brevibacillus laterosporus TaxID=1465 RepID=UPI00035FED07|nr:hypothetical protein [Brevibacillus laterosporus]MED2002462.1 hypothetical protein [Brevibacillus laterosporus]
MQKTDLELKEIKNVQEIISVAVEVDSGWSGGRYQVSIAYNPAREVYIISAPNYWVSMETTQPTNCAYKLQEHDIMSGDAVVIESIVTDILLPALDAKMRDKSVDKPVGKPVEYPDEVMEAIRQNLDLESDDTSMDKKIMKMPKDEIFNLLLTWNGFIGYGDTIREWVNDVYGVELGEGFR